MSDLTAYVLLYRGTKLHSRLIQWQTFSKYSHAAMILPYLGNYPTAPLFEAIEGKGVLVRSVTMEEDGPEHADWRSITVTPEQLIALRLFAIRQLGKGYDWSSVFRFVSRRQHSRSSLGKWFCSEYVAETFVQAQLPLLSPRRHSSAINPGHLDLSPRLATVDPERIPALISTLSGAV